MLSEHRWNDDTLPPGISRAWGDELDRLLLAAGLDDVDVGARTALLQYVALLVKWNRVWNLTAVRDPLEMLSRHLVDSLTLLPHVDAWSGKVHETGSSEASDCHLLDIGSGAGLPVLPLAIVRPDLRCVSVERTDKKARFQRQVVLELGLVQVRVQSSRIEAVSTRARIVTSRAFMEPAAFLVLASTHLIDGGVALLMLGRAERLPSPLPKGWELQSLESVAQAGDTAQRHIAVCRLCTS